MVKSWMRQAEILFFLSQSRMKSYAHDRALGFLWWIFDPLFQIVLYIVFMDFILRIGEPNYPLFLACAVIPWRFLAHGTSAAGVSILAHAGLLKSINLDRIFIPVSEILNSFIYFLYAIPTFAIFMVYYGIHPTFHLLWIPFIILVELVLVVGIGLFLSMFMVKLRDVENLWAFFLQAAFFLSPTVYSADRVPEKFRTLFMLNPAAGIIDSFRRVLLKGEAPDLPYLLWAALVAASVLGIGILVFRRSENEAMRLL